MGSVKLEKDSLTKPVIVAMRFPARNFSPAEMNQCQEEGTAGSCSFPPFLFFFLHPITSNSLFSYSSNYLLAF